MRAVLKVALILGLALLAIFSSSIIATGQAADTVWVQTYTWEEQNNPETAYDNPGRRWFDFPEAGSYSKILMYHTLKCFDDGTAGNLGFPCGEWDYLSYNYLFEHTGELDSNLVEHPHFLYNNQNFEEAALRFSGYSDFYEMLQSYEEVSSSSDEVAYAIGADESAEAYPFGSFLPRMRTQSIWTATELADAGLVAGDINGFRINVESAGSDLQNLSIRIAQSEAAELDGILEADWQQVYLWDTTPEAGWFDVLLPEALSWDGTSSVIIDWSFDNGSLGSDSPVRVSESGFNSTAVAGGSDRYLELDWWDSVKLPDNALEGLDDQVTISFWARGGEELPVNSYIFEGVNASNQRVLNCHLPWSNSNVYWDAGWDGGYDRINALASTEELKGRWNHWTFTKNTNTGVMNMYLNGELWLTGDNRDNPMDGIVKFFIGGSASQGAFWYGDIDEFAIWDVELSEETISDWMYRDLDDSHPNDSNLLVYYRFNSEETAFIQDNSGNTMTGVAVGSPGSRPHAADELFRNVSLETARPDIEFFSGVYETVSVEQVVTQEVPVSPQVLVEYEVAGNYIEIATVDIRWPEGYGYTYDISGSPVDSTFYAADLTIENDTLMYYQPPFEVVNRYELGRFITPYGINLDLDDDGWTWVFDVTDYAPLLQGEVELQCGNWQELLDLRFAFIEGTPPRDVIKVENVWSGSFGATNWEENIPEKTIELEEDAEMVRFKARTSGHGNPGCAEFCFNTHGVTLDGNTLFEWEIMQECADNGLFPQGGTWIYDRAGWCPGAPSPTRDFELTDFINGNTITLDYEAENLSQGNYVFEGQLISYGAPNYEVDAEISEILSPTDFKLYGRTNPVCTSASIRITNNGTSPLTSLDITYGIEGGQEETYTWTGELGFLESTLVEMVYDHSDMYQGGDEDQLQFNFTIDNANGLGADENPGNNEAHSFFHRPETYSYGDGPEDDNRLIIWVKTNLQYWENEYSLYDRLGNEVFFKDDFSEANTSYRDTIQLNGGCYTYQLRDSGDDGLSFFANNDGSGYARFKEVSGPTLHTFEDDFGKEISKTFYWDTDIVSVEELELPGPSCLIYPNPTDKGFQVRWRGLSGEVVLNLRDAQGRLVLSRSIGNNYDQGTEDLTEWNGQGGLYFVELLGENARVVRRLVKE